jgi:hypothetical protein
MLDSMNQKKIVTERIKKLQGKLRLVRAHSAFVHFRRLPFSFFVLRSVSCPAHDFGRNPPRQIHQTNKPQSKNGEVKIMSLYRPLH